MKRYFFMFIFLLGLSLIVSAQKGKISGVVVDGNTNETLVGATVIIQGTYIGTTTNFDGEYELPNLEPGEHNVQVSYISYDNVLIEKIKVEGGKTVTLNIKLMPATMQIEGVVVTTRRIQHTEMSMISSIKTSDLVVTGISAQLISRSQDRDAGQIMRRIPGVTVADDKFVVIRGLNERYNTVMLNDIAAPSMEADVRSFSFDIIPSSQLDRMLVFKSPSAELPADFSGGAVKIFTKSVPEKNGFEISYSTGYEPSTTLRPFYGIERGQGHWAGLNTGAYNLPADIPSDIRSVRNPTELQRLGRQFQNNWVPEERLAFFNQSLSLSGYFKKDWAKVTIGNFTAFNYSNSHSSNEVERYDYNAYNIIEDRSLPIYWYNDNRYKQNIKLGVLHNWGFRYGSNHSVEFKNMFNQISSFDYIQRGGDNYDFQYYPNNHSFTQLFRGIYAGQLSGKHDFLLGRLQVNWLTGYSYSLRNMPDYKRFRSDLTELNGDPSESVIYVPIGGAQPYFLGRFYSDMEENSYTAGFNLTYNVVKSETKTFRPVLKAGAYFEEKDRWFLARNIGYTQAIGFNQELRSLPINELFAPENINDFGGIKIDEQSNPNDSYQAYSTLYAYYVSASLPFSDKVKLVAGLRVEDYTQRMVSATTERKIDEVFQKTDFFPSVNLSYSFNDKMLVRTAYGRTINRPEFRERAPFSFYDFDYNLNKTGNIFLKDALIDNAEIRWEYYPSLSEMINFGFFYKHFTSPIESVFEPGAGSGGAKNFSFSNAESAYSYGVELDFRKSLGGILTSTVLDNFSLVFNASLIKSEVTIGSGSGSGRDTDNRPLQGQSPYIVNAGLFYNNEDHNLQVNLQHNIIGKRIYSVGFTTLDRSRVEYPDVYEMPRNLLDLSVSKSFSNNITLRLGISDLLNQTNVMLQDAKEDGKFDKKTDQILQIYRPGTLYTFSINYKL
jgi:outer membrane receptor for ferrienterochelin and colicin